MTACSSRIWLSRPTSGWLITRRSQVQILPPLLKRPAKAGLYSATTATTFPVPLLPRDFRSDIPSRPSRTKQDREDDGEDATHDDDRPKELPLFLGRHSA